MLTNIDFTTYLIQISLILSDTVLQNHSTMLISFLDLPSETMEDPENDPYHCSSDALDDLTFKESENDESNVNVQRPTSKE